MNRLTSEDGQLYACGNGLCSEEGIECTNCHYANEAFLKLAEYENVGLQPEHIDSIIEQLLGYLDAEQAGLLIEFPCKIGTPVYEICTDAGWHRVDELIKYHIEKVKFNFEHIDEIGKTVFLTREEAEKALKEKEEI